MSYMGDELQKLREENRTLKKRIKELSRSEERYKAIFDHSYVSIWEEDFSAVYDEIQRLKDSGIEDIGAYLRSNTQELDNTIAEIGVIDVNNATLRLYNAESKEQLLGSLHDVFEEDSRENMIDEMVAIAEGRSFYEGETIGRKITGELMHLLLRITIPSEESKRKTRRDYDYVLVGIIDITERKRREREVKELLENEQEQQKFAESLRATTLAVTSSMDTSEVLDRIIGESRKVAPYDAVNVCLFDETTIRVVRLSGYGKYGVSREQIEEIYNMNGLDNINEMKRKKEPVIVEDTYADPLWTTFSSSTWVRSYLGIPMLFHDEVIGMINFDSEIPHAFSDETSKKLEPFGHAAAVALENARLYQEMRRELSERKQAEEELKKSLDEKEVLLKEIHHRVKNNLNVVASLLNLQHSRIETVEQAKEALLSSQNRVQSMSRVHESLYESSDLSSIDIERYISSLIDDLVHLYDTSGRVSYELDIDELHLDINRAVPFGLILNEVVTNALVHAFPGEKGGVLRIELHLGSNGAVYTRVTDDGVGLPEQYDEEELSDSLGLELITILTEQLGGTHRVTGDEGTSFELDFSL